MSLQLGSPRRPLLSAEIRQRALEAEELASRSCSWNGDQRGHLAFVCDQVLAELEPTAFDRDSRATVVQYMDNFVRKTIAGTSTFPFGSFLMNMFTRSSDLDLSLEVNCGNVLTRQERIFYLKRLAACLHQQRGVFDRVQPVYKATVPLVKFIDVRTGLQCDVSVENKDGIFKSTFLGALCATDNRFRPLCFLLKHWAKVHRINDASGGGLSSYALTLLTAFHLQTCYPPVLPPFSSILGGFNMQDIGRTISYVPIRARAFQGYGSRNLETVGELFRTFFLKMLSVKQLWLQGICASTFHGQWISKLEMQQTAWLCVEDFVDHSQNVARSVTEKAFDTIYRCLDKTFDQFQKPVTDPHTLKNAIFGGGCSPFQPPQPPSHTFPNPRQYRPTFGVQFQRQQHYQQHQNQHQHHQHHQHQNQHQHHQHHQHQHQQHHQYHQYQHQYQHHQPHQQHQYQYLYQHRPSSGSSNSAR